MTSRQRLAVFAHDLGGSQGPLLLFLHANGFHGRAYLPMVPVLAPYFRCVALDLPGHGSAPPPNRPFTEEDLLGAVREYVNLHDIKHCYCFGHSLGGTMAALLQLERPQTFSAMFLFEPVIRPFREPPLSSRSPTESRAVMVSLGSGGAVAGCSRTAADVSAFSDPAAASGIGGSSGGGCLPSPSLLSAPPRAAAPDSLLARIARKRQAVFPGVGAAKTSLGSKPPFNAFHPHALDAYLARGGLRPLDPPSRTEAAESATGAAGGVRTGVPVLATDGQGAAATTTTDTDTAADASSPVAVTLSCTPETEARVYEALEPPPWRDWRQLTQAGGLGADKSCGASCGGGSGGGSDASYGAGDSQAQHGLAAERGEQECEVAARGCGGGGGGPVGRLPCRLAIAVGQDVGLHAVLARWGTQVAELVPGARLVRFPSLFHLGPMEDPTAVATAVLDFFLEGVAGGKTADGGAAGWAAAGFRSRI